MIGFETIWFFFYAGLHFVAFCIPPVVSIAAIIAVSDYLERRTK